MDTKTLDRLMEIKKKGDSSKADKKLFADEWLAYATENGFDDAAETYLHGGFTFQGMVPFLSYLEGITDKQAAIHRLLSGKHFYKNKAMTFKMMVHLLALLLLNYPDEKKVISQVLLRLPELSLSKENKRLGDITKSVEKYFVQVLNADTTLPELNSLDLNPAIVKSFRKMLSETIAELLTFNKNSPQQLSVIANLDKWLSSENQQSGKSVAISISTESKEQSFGQRQSKTIPECTSDNDYSTENSSKINSMQNWQDGLDIITKTINSLEKNLLRSQSDLSNLLSENSDLSKKYSELQNSLDYERGCNESQKMLISKLNNEIEMLKHKNQSLENKVREKENEITERIKLTDVLSRDRSKQSEEVLVRIAAKLKVEYRDYLDAESLPMNKDLGENMRLQLGSIFSILKKNGINLD